MSNEEINDFINKIKKKTNTTVRVKGSKNNPTKALSFNNSRSSHYPYLEVDHGKQTDLYEIEKSFKKSTLPDQIGKWILFSIHAKRRSGDFYLVVESKSKAQYEKIIKEKKLDIQLITI